ncbi:hypothetical protein J7E93_01280 [Streptomyces sp. ISL-36]|uniref:hypothetical protein n=1 Tax=Streptomyces sp. ISL-36 TaxID=2819182 RepID=UPI001BEAC178|nr:hypothetical protein [Streptomyces sp. ISL-36]MBT2438779.1 hypothetical protein [Streptomyces sp. ISL-36]
MNRRDIPLAPELDLERADQPLTARQRSMDGRPGQRIGDAMGALPTSSRHLSLEGRPPPDTPTLRRLPGKARPRKDVLLECEAEAAEMRGYIPRVLWGFLIPDLTRVFRWRVQLDCGCIPEVLTREDGPPPHEMRWKEHAHGSQLPPGQMICWHDDSPPAPYRMIAEWGERSEVTLPASPVEPPDGIDPKVWAVIRHDEPHTSAFWKVTLTCGHAGEAVAPNLNWTPASGPRQARPDRVLQMCADFEQAWHDNPELQAEQDRDHTRRMLADGWPTPRPEQLCHSCPQVRMILAYERVGWLVPRRQKAEKTESSAPTPSHPALERRLQRAEAVAERLRAELDQLE